ncbi:MAG: hydroxylacyl-CoA dehydrogenase, partial [Aldersonia sp.]|nr:hydroxylacyl-CoA dehydrogenase [Aldersonia sp.]
MSTVTVVGAGVIGLSWARLFADHQWRVVVTDPREDLADVVASADLAADVRMEADLATAVSDSDLVQECGPERLELKRKLFGIIAAAAPSTAIFASSSSSLLPTDMAEGNPAPDRILVAHPFNPPHLMPLVELVPGRQTSNATMESAHAIYESIGKVPVRLKKEIRGFIGNRLQKALNTEATYLVQQDYITPADL